MATYEVLMSDRAIQRVDGADTYQQEGQMTTFFATRRQVIDSWSIRLASYRTSEIISVRRMTAAEPGSGAAERFEVTTLHSA